MPILLLHFSLGSFRCKASVSLNPIRGANQVPRKKNGKRAYRSKHSRPKIWNFLKGHTATLHNIQVQKPYQAASYGNKNCLHLTLDSIYKSAPEYHGRTMNQASAYVES